MDLDLRGDDVRADPPRTLRITGLFDQRRRRFIAGRFDAEHVHGRNRDRSHESGLGRE
jgi:hypothetical protein